MVTRLKIRVLTGYLAFVFVVSNSGVLGQQQQQIAPTAERRVAQNPNGMLGSLINEIMLLNKLSYYVYINFSWNH